MTNNNIRFKAIVLVAMCCALFMAYLDDTVVNVALPKIQSSLSSDLSGLQWILNAYTLPAASLVLTSGTLGDIYGRRRVFLAGLVIFTIASVICGFAPNLGILIAGRTLQGIGAAAMVPNSLAILTDTFSDPQEKTKAIAIWSAVSGLALVVGPAFGGVLLDTLGWQSVFFLNVPIGAIAFGLTFQVVKESKNLRKQHLDVLGLLLSIVLLASLTYALTEGNAGVWRSPLIVWLLTVAGLSSVAFLVVESRSSHPMLPLHLFNNPTFAIVNSVSVLIYFAFVSLLLIFSLFLQQVQGYSAAATGMCFVPMNAAFVIALLVSGWFAARIGWRFVITVGLLTAGVATFLFLGISVDTQYEAIKWKLVLSGFGGGMAIAPLAAVAMSAAPLTQAGIASAVFNASARLGSILGVALQGTILTQRLVSDLKRSLMAWGIHSNLQDRLIADALHGGAIPTDLPASISPLALHQAISNAFVAGVHATVFVAGAALLVAALLILAFVQPTFNPKNPSLSVRRERGGG